MSGARLGVAVVTAAACFFAGRIVLGSQLAAAESARLSLPPLPAEGRRDLALARVVGQVERGTSAAGVTAGREGQLLGAGETLRVGGGAKASLRLGIASAIELSPGSEVTAVSTSSSEVVLRLDAGNARVVLAHPDRTLRLTSPEGGAVIARGGTSTRFLVAVHPGRLAVFNDAEAAPVRLAAADAEVEVPENRVSWSVEGGAPRPPIEPPAEPGLEIEGAALAVQTSEGAPAEGAPAEGAAAEKAAAEGAPAEAAAAEAAPAEGADPDEAAPTGVDPAADGALVVVKGRAHPLALVRVGEVVAVVQADGSFEVTLPKQDEPYAVLASLPTGSEALLEVAPPSAEAAGAPAEARPGAAAPDDAAAEDASAPPPEEPPSVEEPKPTPKPKARKKRRSLRRQKAASASKQGPAEKPSASPRTQARTQKPAPKKKKSGVVTWGAAP